MALWKILVLALLAALAFQGSRGLYETTEGRYAECAREMLASGHFLEPTLDSQPHWTKPPMTYWAVAAGIAALGRNAWGARAFQVATFCLTVAAVWFLAKLIWGLEAAPYAALVFTTSPLSVGAAGALGPDNLLTLWETLALLAFWAGARLEKRSCFTLMWLAFGAAFLTKGPPGLLPLLGLMPAYYLLGRRNPDLPSFFPLSGLVLFVLVGLGWYLYEAALHPGLMRYWIGEEVINRVATAKFHRNAEWSKAITIYWPVLGLGGLPWVGLLLWKGRNLPWPTGRWFDRAYWEDRIEYVLVAMSIILPLIVFTVSKSRLPLYVLPLFAPVALLLGRGLEVLVRNRKLEARIVRRVGLASLIILVGIKGGLAWKPSPKDMARLSCRVQAALASFPHSHLYVVSDDGHLYGLDFYLDGMMTEVGTGPPILDRSTLPSPARLSRMTTADRAQGTVSAIMVQKGDLGEVEKFLVAGKTTSEPATPYRTKSLDSHWMLIISNSAKASPPPGMRVSSRSSLSRHPLPATDSKKSVSI
jgi:4-amino-4-deoxy-L-arabinose transferase-like glycosyltransferase